MKTILAVAFGLLFLWIPAIFDPGTGPVNDSIKPGHGKVDYWSWRWLNWWYCNTEDGRGLFAVMIDGTRYRDAFPAWVPDCAVIYAWSAWRNSANNLKRPLRTDSWLPAGAKSVWPL